MSNREKQLHFFVNEEEDKIIKRKMKEAGIERLSVYLRKMAIEGYILKLDLSDLREAVRLLRINSNNLNQYVKKANEMGKVYAEDIQDVKQSQEELWRLMKDILARLSAI
ncbi:mobilization protein MobC [Herbinix hemicellulosilytica]|uniref:Uncharacterized protein n=1 Tax=Herbinix hemicellulosilytica TaxID=1564487 RepID=A0A0H5SXL5_HERHM|nr:plasmid mobilization relaxosome protein MobC [Herbinix hemicellulosilytica]RBP57084.1 mobilization protein MobC [Herbinix hemicellulosilytica]CRZ35093.1 hypothetical protein HHT355_1894 [Herbinix hemicellulosilytica]